MLFRVVLFLGILSTAVAANEPPAYPMQRLVLGDSEESALAVTPDLSSPAIVYTRGLPLLEAPDFAGAIRPFVGKTIDKTLLNSVADAIAKYARAHDRLITKVVIPNQNVADGTLRLVVLFGRFNEVAFAGNKWFSRKVLEERLGIKPGDEVRLSVLEEAANWANTNPFRRVKVIVNPIENQPGRANLLVGVQERLPWRFSASVDNYGTEALGERHYTAAVQAGNLWGRDHEGSYQFITTDAIHVYQAHLVTYRVPLPWRHFIEATALYTRANPMLSNAAFAQAAQNESADLKYTIPLRNGDDPMEVRAGLEFKRGNNNLEYAGLNVFASSTDTFQLMVGGSVVKHDKHGAWAVGGNVFASPGNVNSHNTRAAYAVARTEAPPQYAYANMSLQRLQTLGRGWDLSTRVIGQICTSRLIGGEQLTIGGATSIRGYRTNVFAGDYGFVFGADLLTPKFTTPLAKLNKALPAAETRFAIFYDAGEVFAKSDKGGTLDFPTSPLASVGLGVRTSVSSNFSLNFDYGWQLRELPALYHLDDRGQGHIKVVLAF